jgi:hypothetical protein
MQNPVNTRRALIVSPATLLGDRPAYKSHLGKDLIRAVGNFRQSTADRGGVHANLFSLSSLFCIKPWGLGFGERG